MWEITERLSWIAAIISAVFLVGSIVWVKKSSDKKSSKKSWVVVILFLVIFMLGFLSGKLITSSQQKAEFLTSAAGSSSRPIMIVDESSTVIMINDEMRSFYETDFLNQKWMEQKEKLGSYIKDPRERERMMKEQSDVYTSMDSAGFPVAIKNYRVDLSDNASGKYKGVYDLYIRTDELSSYDGKIGWVVIYSLFEVE